MHPFERDKDNTSVKNQRRAILDELCARHTSLLATDYPGEFGGKFIKKLARDRKELAITLVNKNGFHRRYTGDGLDNVKRMKEDIFIALLNTSATLIDIDLFGGIPLYGKTHIETATSWKQILLTFQPAWRHKTEPGALGGLTPDYFVETWCKAQGWKNPIMPMLPYRHPNKNAIMGLVDERGPKYWTFLIER